MSETFTLGKAINTGLRRAMERDPKVLIMGEDVGKLGGVFRITDGLQKDFGEDRVIDTPLAESGIIGTVQLVLDQPENQAHRADLSKMLVHRRARRRGLGAALMGAAEQMARDCGKTLLVLDTVTGSDAERLYARLGWIRVGTIPDYALLSHGGLRGTKLYYKRP